MEHGDGGGDRGADVLFCRREASKMPRWCCRCLVFVVARRSKEDAEVVLLIKTMMPM